MNRDRINLIALALILLLVGMSVPIYFGSSLVEKHVQKRLVSDVVSIVGHVFDNIAMDLLNMVGDQDIVVALYHDEELRKRIEDRLSLLVTDEVKYVYIVYRDDEGKFRFLVDGSKEDKGELGEKLDVFNEEKWIEAISTGKDVVIIQENLYTLGATYLKPIGKEGNTRALLVADFSINKIREIQGALDLIKNATLFSVMSALAFLGFGIYQYLKTRAVEKTLYIDKLTGLYTKNYIDDKGGRIDHGKYYVTLLDLDDFRKINATYGEEAGDNVLKNFAKGLRRFLRIVLLSDTPERSSWCFCQKISSRTRLSSLTTLMNFAPT